MTRFEYDDLGRQTLVIRNYVNGTPSGVTGDDDICTRYVFTDGLQTKMWVDLDGDDTEDADDQVTVYTYGVAKGASAGDSEIGAGHLLQKITYPDSTSGGDAVTFAYNAQGQEVYRRDQAGNVFETVYDTGGRETARKVTTLAGGFDNAVLRIGRTYTSRGQPELITQYDAATSGTIVNEVKYSYSDWPAVLKSYEEDRDSAVGAGTPNDYEVEYTVEANTTGRNTIRRTFEKIYYAASLEQSTVYTYGRTGADLDDELSRVSRVKVGGATVADYTYTGVSRLVGIDYPEPEVFWAAFGASTGDYPDLDAFNRVASATWSKDLTTDVAFYDVDYVYDENGNILRQVDNILNGSGTNKFDAAYSMDDLNRLTSTIEGYWNGSSISTVSRQQSWTLTQTGNWDLNRWDHNGDGVYTGTDELDDRGTFNEANEWTARDIDDDSSNDYALTYDAVGNLIDDGEDYEYGYDAFRRLRTIRKTTDQSLVAEYTYNGIGHRIGWHYDVDGDGTVESNGDDPWFYFAYDDRSRLVATYRASDTEPKELFVNHSPQVPAIEQPDAASAAILRDKDANSGWASSADGTREERVYFTQTPGTRGDVVALITSAGGQAGQTRYSSYGVPFGLPAGDLDSDGDVDGTDASGAGSLLLSMGYHVLADLDLDGDLDSTDATGISSASGTTMGRGVLALDPGSSFSIGSGNRLGHQGRRHETINALLSIEHSFVVHLALGRTLRRDTDAYALNANLYELDTSNIAAPDTNASSGIPSPCSPYRSRSRINRPNDATQEAQQSVGVWCYNVAAFMACARSCRFDYVNASIDAYDAFQQCNGAALAIKAGCIGSCAEHCDDPFNIGCILRCELCDINYAVENAICRAAYYGVLAGINLHYGICLAVCRDSHSMWFDHGPCPVGWAEVPGSQGPHLHPPTPH